jgi:tetratricopeptide (TPR) repeat protein
MTAPFFAPRGQRPVLDFVLTDFPFPLAIAYSRLQRLMDQQEPVEAALQIRDALETFVKFTASVAVADCLRTDLLPEEREQILAVLFNPLSLGHWKTLLLERALRPLAPLARAGRLADSGRRLPELYGVFYNPRGGGFSPLAAELFQAKDVVNWRNKEWGHGCFRRDRDWYAATVTDWLPVLEKAYTALREALRGWKLTGITPGGERIDWSGALDLPPTVPHEHRPAGGPPLPMHLVHADGRFLELTPLLTMQTCMVAECGQPAAFFCEGNERKKDKYKSNFLEYMEGHKNQHLDWEEVRRLAGELPAGFDWERSGYDWREARSRVEAAFRDFDSEYRRPDYLLDAVWQFTEEQASGYVHVVGAGGVGKTYLVRGLEREGKERGVPVLAYHIRPGALSDYRTFITELSDLAREKLHWRTQEIQTAGVEGIAGLPAQFAAFVRKLLELNAPGTLAIVLDGLDELREPGRPTDAWISDFLPAASELPERCFVVLTRREAVRPHVGDRLALLRRGAGDRWLELPIRTGAEANRAVLRSYLWEKLPEAFRTPEAVAAVLERSGGVFLYAFHLSRALQNGVFADTAALPAGERFYPAYLERLRGQAGGGLYERVHLRTLLLLAAARQPLTLAQLERYGVSSDRLHFALLDLGDFLRLHRGRRWHDSLGGDGDDRYEIAHEEFVRYVTADAGLSRLIRQTHADVGRKALARHRGRWEQLDAEDEAEVYELRFVLPHLEAGGLTDEAEAVRNDEDYANACWRVGSLAYERGRLHFVVDLIQNAETVFRELVQAGRAELANDLAVAIMNRGVALDSLGRLEEAVSACDEAIAILRALVQAGRAELANDLAGAIMNRGNALQQLGRLEAAVSACDEAIAIRRALVQAGRAELANDLASALLKKAFVLERMQDWQRALECYREAIAWWEACVRAGMRHLSPALLKAVRCRLMTFLDLSRWEEAAEDVLRFLQHARPVLQTADVPEGMRREFDAFADLLRNLAPESRAHLDGALGDDAAAVRQVLDF